MELFGIILAIPAALVASVAYCSFLTKIIVPTDLVRKAMWVASAGVLFLLAVEILLVVTIGPVRSQASIGPVFYLVDLAIFFLGTPSLANLIILRNARATFRPWWWAVPVCTVFAVALILLQYGVSEALYGVDGTDGPFSNRRIPPPVTESASSLTRLGEACLPG
jgi:hypothetical protein